MRLFPRVRHCQAIIKKQKKCFVSLASIILRLMPIPQIVCCIQKSMPNANECIVCGISRWKSSDVHPTDELNQSSKKKKIPVKVLRYFPLKQKLQRLYMSSKTTSYMKWHVDGCMRGEMMRHPINSLSWKNFDKVHPSFAQEPQNVRFDLASDGFNPFGNMSIDTTCGL